MTKKQEERDWSEIMAEVRNKAKSEIDEFVDEIKPRVEELVKKVREANFHDEAEELLSKLKTMADEFAHSEDGPKAKAPTGKRASNYRYLDDNGKEYMRPPRAAGKTWTDAQKKKYKAAYDKKHKKK